MYAVLKTGGKQYRVEPGDTLRVEKLEVEEGASVRFDEVLMIGGEGETAIGAPLVDGAAVVAEVLAQVKGEKVISFVRRRRKHSSKRTRGHRQRLTVLRVTGIQPPGGAMVEAAARGEAADVAAGGLAADAGGEASEVTVADGGRAAEPAVAIPPSSDVAEPASAAPPSSEVGASETGGEPGAAPGAGEAGAAPGAVEAADATGTPREDEPTGVNPAVLATPAGVAAAGAAAVAGAAATVLEANAAAAEGVAEALDPEAGTQDEAGGDAERKED